MMIHTWFVSPYQISSGVPMKWYHRWIRCRNKYKSNCKLKSVMISPGFQSWRKIMISMCLFILNHNSILFVDFGTEFWTFFLKLLLTWVQFPVVNSYLPFSKSTPLGYVHKPDYKMWAVKRVRIWCPSRQTFGIFE